MKKYTIRHIAKQYSKSRWICKEAKGNIIN